MKRVALIAAAMLVGGAGEASAVVARSKLLVFDEELIASDFVYDSYRSHGPNTEAPIDPVVLGFKISLNPAAGAGYDFDVSTPTSTGLDMYADNLPYAPKFEYYGAEGRYSDHFSDELIIGSVMAGGRAHSVFGDETEPGFGAFLFGYPPFSCPPSDACPPISAYQITPNGAFYNAQAFSLSAQLISAPEPATWASMLVGFGGIGSMLRRARLGWSNFLAEDRGNEYQDSGRNSGDCGVRIRGRSFRGDGCFRNGLSC